MMERNETQRKTAKHGTWSLRVAACRYSALLELEKAGLATQADVERAHTDLERAALAHATKAKAGMVRAILIAAALAIAACGGTECPMFGRHAFTAALVKSADGCPPPAQSIAVEISGDASGLVATEDAGEQHKLSTFRTDTECPSIAYWNDGVNVHQYNVATSPGATDAMFIISIADACQADYEMHAP